MAVAYDFDEQLALGKKGETRLVRQLRANGLKVRYLGDSNLWRRRDVDLMVGEWNVEVKSDTHAPRALFAELTVNGQPGYVFKSRADYLLYWFSRYDVAYWVPMYGLAWWVEEHGHTLPRKSILSTRRGRTWTAEGIVVPLDALDALGWLKELKLDG